MAWALWITGIPGAGKSAIAAELARLVHCKVLRPDLFRKKIVPKPTYSKQERTFLYKELAKILASEVKAGKNVVMDATDNLGVGRAKARQLIKNFAVIQLKCSIEEAEKRESSRKDIPSIHDLYARARAGEIELPGLTAEYVVEKKPEILIDSEKVSPKKAAKKITSELRKWKWIG